MTMKRILIAAVLLAAMSGCASVMNDTTQGVKVETRTEDGKAVAGADCRLTNDHGTIVVKSGDTAAVRRSFEDLSITCVHPDNTDAVARAVSRVNGAMFGNIIVGGAIGAMVDHSRGTAYTYPTWIQLVFGKTLIFDREFEAEGQPTPGAAPVEKTARN
jgi:hypothetical protein